MVYEKRTDIPQKYKWDLSAIFKTREDFSKAVEKANTAITALEKLKGKLGSRENLLKCLIDADRVLLQVEHIYWYAWFRNDLDTKDADSQADFAIAVGMRGKFSEAVSFMRPEISALSEAELDKYIADKDFSDFDRYLSIIKKDKAHVLSAEEERIIASFGPISSGFEEAFDRLDSGDLDFGTITVEGKKIKLSHGMYAVHTQHPDQKVRKANFEAYYKPYISHANTLSGIYHSSVKNDWNNAKLHKFNSTLECALFNEEVDKDVYDNLIKCVNDNLKPLHEYIALRKEILGVKTLNMYDMSVPLVKGAELKYDFDKAFELVKKGLEPLGKDYQKLLQKSYDEQWMDVYETPTKKSGAYNLGLYGVHPFVLLNYQETTNEIMTIAHELGHAIHSYYTEKAQPYMKSDYTTFVAEVASTCNEILLQRYLLSTTSDVNVKKYLLSTYLDMLRGTMYRQTMFAEFEAITHDMVEHDIPLTCEAMCEKYYELNKKYYGSSVKHNEQIRYEWVRIPHFYRAFYVYKYATGIISAVCLADKILKEGKPAVENYIKFLSLGSSLDPVSELKIAGVDLSRPEPFATVAESFRDTLKQLKQLCKEYPNK